MFSIFLRSLLFNVLFYAVLVCLAGLLIACVGAASVLVVRRRRSQVALAA